MAVAVSGMVIAATPAEAAVAISVSGTRITHAPPYPEQLLPEFFVNDAVSRIDYPASLFGMDRSIGVAVKGIVDAVETTPGPVVVAGFSQGAVAVARAKQALMALPPQERPDPGQLSFVTVGDPSGPTGILRKVPVRIPVIGLTPLTAPQTPYDTVTVNAEYDGWGDFPDRPGNLLSVANALLGVVYIHGRYETVPGGLDVSGVPARNITMTTNTLGGHTTTYLIPTEKLPLVQPLRDLGVPESVVAAIEKPLKARVDAGYRRNDAAPASAATRHPAAKARPGEHHSRSAA